MLATAIDRLFEGRGSAVARDLKLNLKKVTTEGALPAREAALALLAAATSLGSRPLTAVALESAAALGLSDEEVAEAKDAAAIMGMLNRYYRFKHMLEESKGKDYVQEHYRAAGLRMNGIAKPAMGKAAFEMLALAVSVINGCATCIVAHEEELRKHGVTPDQIHDLARLAAAAAGVAALFQDHG